MEWACILPLLLWLSKETNCCRFNCATFRLPWARSLCCLSKEFVSKKRKKFLDGQWSDNCNCHIWRNFCKVCEKGLYTDSREPLELKVHRNVEPLIVSILKLNSVRNTVSFHKVFVHFTCDEEMRNQKFRRFKSILEIFLHKFTRSDSQQCSNIAT